MDSMTTKYFITKSECLYLLNDPNYDERTNNKQRLVTLWKKFLVGFSLMHDRSFNDDFRAVLCNHITAFAFLVIRILMCIITKTPSFSLSTHHLIISCS